MNQPRRRGEKRRICKLFLLAELLVAENPSLDDLNAAIKHLGEACNILKSLDPPPTWTLYRNGSRTDGHTRLLTSRDIYQFRDELLKRRIVALNS